MGKKISVIIPGYNEEEIIRDSILRVEKELSYLNRPYEILIVNDGSTDKTGIILKEFMDCGKHPYISVIS
ncbi:MAG: glycosyltransferase, partial [Lutibacter sp.]|nr:glycosyltransferase [Lutibacter sp.]